MTDEEVLAATREEIAEYLPAAERAEVEHARVNRIPMAIHCPFPGTERRRPPTDAPVDGLLLAGDWIQTHLPSSMESAVMAGWRAVEAVLADAGRPRELAVEHPEPEGLTGLVDRASQWVSPKRIRRRLRDFGRRRGRGADRERVN